MNQVANKKVISLAARSRRQLLLLGVVIFIGLVTLVTFFSFHQIEQATDSYMRMEAVKLERQFVRNGFVVSGSEEFMAYGRWQDIPVSIRQLFDEIDVLPSKVLAAERTNRQGDREYVYLVYSNTLANTPDKRGIYVIDISDAKTIDALVESIVEQTFVDASVITGGFMLLFFLVIGAMFRRALRPLNLLVEWSEQITEQAKQQPNQELEANFSIKELNDIAEHLLESLKQVHEFNVREQQFLQHASHELRTPLAIIQASLDTLMVRTPKDNPSYAAVQRATKASNNMIVLTEAFLRLARQSNSPIPLVRIEIRKILQELIEELNYLLDGKEVTIELRSEPLEIVIEQELFRILLTNMVSNAFQHCCDGDILIEVDKDAILIVNSIEDSGHLPSLQSFGLGVQLVERIAIKLGCEFSFMAEYEDVVVGVYWRDYFYK